jgi:hypothetical protein
MKNILKKLFLLAPFLCACSMIPKNEKFRSQLIQDFSKDMQKNKHLTLIAIGGGQNGRLFCLSYVTQKKLNLEQARKLLIDVCEGFLERVNNDQQLRPYLVGYPYNSTNIDVMIRFVDHNNDRTQPPYIALASNHQGKVFYNTSTISEELSHLHKETYEEACKIANEKQN